jgi:hypothetical protein
MGLLAKLFRRREPRTHDLVRGWTGWMQPEDNGQSLRLGDWSYFKDGDPDRGDYVIIPNKKTRETTRYRVMTFKRYADPDDMWTMTAVFAPRFEGQK